MQMTLMEYASLIHLNDRYIPEHNAFGSKEELVNDLLAWLMEEQKQARKLEIPHDFKGRRDLLKGLLTVREAAPLAADFLNQLDALLQIELTEKGTIAVEPLDAVSALVPHCRFSQADKLSLWQGDITRLGADAIVNAANRYMLGCFQPYHACIDNAIHSAAGPQLREDCSIIMSIQGEPEATGAAKITRGYHLPARFVLHTVGPIVQNGAELLDSQREALAACYRSCLELANEIDEIRTVAFCAISTGVFGFPKSEASRIAVQTVNDWLNTHTHHFEKIIFNVFSDDDYTEYLHVFQS